MTSASRVWWVRTLSRLSRSSCAGDTDVVIPPSAVTPLSLTVYLLPWLTQHQRVDFGRVSVASKAWLAHDQGVPAGLGELAAVYVNQSGYPCETSVMWFQGGDVVGAVNDRDLGVLRAHAQVLGAAAIVENRYFDSSVSLMTGAHFEAFFHRYQPGMTHMSLQRRRRDGSWASGWPLTTVRFTVPSGAAIRGDLVVNQPLLEALAAGIGSPDLLNQRIQRSIGHFLDGNRLDEADEIHRDLIWLGAALENLLNVSPPIAKNLGKALTDLFDADALTQTTWTDWKGRSQSGPWLARWVEEFYDHRSAIHGQPARTTVWQPWEHGLIATIVWGLSIKLLLANAGRYSLADNDRIEIQALDERIATGSPVQSRWGDALLHACKALGL